jgi:phosphotriesterase-related protein
LIKFNKQEKILMKTRILILSVYVFLSFACSVPGDTKNINVIQHVNGEAELDSINLWLSHEHILVDFIGADSIEPSNWDHQNIISEILPYLKDLNEYNVKYFVDATPMYLGREASLLKKISDITGINILTNTGLYGARNNKFIPGYAFEFSAGELAEIWTDEFVNGIDGTTIKPGFIKIGIDNSGELSEFHMKIVRAAAITHLNTGLTIASHTGKAQGLWPQLQILEEMKVSPKSFIWVHAQNEDDNNQYKKAAEKGCWISLDGLAYDIDRHLAKIIFAKNNGFLDQILISHDAGWYDPQKEIQSIKPFTKIFTELIPKLRINGFSEKELEMLLSFNPVKAYSIK